MHRFVIAYRYRRYRIDLIKLPDNGCQKQMNTLTAVLLVRVVLAVRDAVAHRGFPDAALSLRALEERRHAPGAVSLVRAVLAVKLAVAQLLLEHASTLVDAAHKRLQADALRCNARVSSRKGLRGPH